MRSSSSALRRSTVKSNIAGVTRPEQVDENAGASGLTLGDDVLVAVDEALGDAVGP